MAAHETLKAELDASGKALAAAERRADQLAADLDATARTTPTALERPASFGRDVTWRSIADTAADATDAASPRPAGPKA